MKQWWRFLIIVFLGLSLSLGFKQSLTAQVLPSQLVQQAQKYYHSGNFKQSINLLEQANRVYQSQEQNLQQAQVLSLTALAQQQLGAWKLARQNIIASFALVKSIAPSKYKTQVLAQIWNSKGHFQLVTGQNNEALSNWEKAEELYREIDDRLGISGTLLGQAQALEKMGFHRRSCNRVLEAFNQPDYNCANLTATQLATIVHQVESQADDWQLEGLISISNSLLSMGKLSQAQVFIEASQIINQSLAHPSPQVEAKILLGLGNINKAIALKEREQENEQSFTYHSEKAIDYYQKLNNFSAASHLNNRYRLLAQLNQLSLLINTKKWTTAQKLANKIELNFERQFLKPNLYAEVKFARSLELLKQENIPLKYSWQDIADIYLDAIAQARATKNHRIESYALGYLGNLQQQRNTLELGVAPQQLIEQALNLAQTIHAPEIAYRWQWKLGRIYRQQEKRKEAIASYQAALANLNDLRSDLVALTREIQFDFSEQIEPIYREYVDLLLDSQFPSDLDLESARNVIEALQVAELDNYFQDACLTFEEKSIEKIDNDAAIIYTIILPDRLEVIMAMGNSQKTPSGQVFHHHSYAISQEQLRITVEQLRQYITEPDRLREVQQLSAQIYDWLIRPLTADLASQQPKTLVFVLDSILQNIPMSVLYDGEQYLVEKYAIALTPGLRLLNPQVNSQPAQFLAGGISEPLKVANQQFSRLSSVANELNIFTKFDSSSVLLNAQFTATNLLQKLNSTSASVIHIATHGQFSSNPNQTFLLLWQKLLTIQDFSNLLQSRTNIVSNPIELLVLSACETASGDRRAALGLAGVAVRSGSLSTLATLWRVNDYSTTVLMENFYQQLNNKQLNKAEKLRQAQLKLWQTVDKDWKVPAFWSAYIMIGNWH
ncbi:CHAT domain-containing protein [Pleurocapsa sp. PCC 7319]|uniref:CHAT domain-containing protein n=1 Tax=Pleurocapsa sp. PCC 7319 TaxID=118161 RepID=UPI000349DA84|nr:CHAT domain-containing protein [Pleurocapsa sp. PCC 7319]